MNYFCRKCYQYLLKTEKIKTNVPLDKIVFRCKQPIYTINGYGDLVKLVWDCDKQEYKEIRER